MEIDITHLFNGTVDTWPLSGSVATHGANAARETWASANVAAAERPLLDTPAALEDMRGWAKASGGWEPEEIAAWSDQELNALFLQLVAGDMREAGLDGIEIDDDEAWAQYHADAEVGRVSGNLYRSGVQVFYSLEGY